MAVLAETELRSPNSSLPSQAGSMQVWVAAETGRVCYTEADVQRMKASWPKQAVIGKTRDLF